MSVIFGQAAGGNVAGTIKNARGVVAGTTTYNPGDVAIYRGGYILVTTQFTTGSGTTPFVSSSNYIRLTSQNNINASDWGVTGDASSDNITALNLVMAYVGSLTGGGFIDLPGGQIMTSATVDIPTQVTLMGKGSGFFGTQLKLLPNSNCDVVSFHRSTGAGNSNAFWGGLWNLSVHGNSSLQAVDDFHHGVNITTNPTTTQQSGDPDFDPGHALINVHVRTCTGHGFFHSGRSDVMLNGVHAKYNGGCGFFVSFDTRIVACTAGFNGMAGFHMASSSSQATASKAYNNGTGKTWTTGLNWTAGQQAFYSGTLYRAKVALTANTTAPSADPTNWAAVFTSPSYGVGFYITGFELALAGCDSQQNSCWNYYIKSTSASVQGTSTQAGWDNPGGGTALITSNPNNYAGVCLDGAAGCVINVAANGHNSVLSPLRVINGTARCDITMAGDTSAGSTLSADSMLIAGSSNAVRWNGTVLNLPGITSATLALPVLYVRTGGSWMMPFGAQNSSSNITPTLNRLYLIPMFLPRVGLTVTDMSIRVFGAATAGGIARLGLYTSDASGDDAFSLLIEPTSVTQIDTTTTGIKVVTLGTPQVISTQNLWLGVVAQVAAPALAAIQGSLVTGQNNNPVPSVALYASTSGSLPATALGAGAAVFADTTAPATMARVIG